MSRLDVDEHLLLVGNFGVYQWLALFMDGLLVAAFGSQMFASVFIQATPKFRCDDAEYLNAGTGNVTFDSKCSYALEGVNRTCSSFYYDRTDFDETVITKFDLVCGRTYLSTLVGMLWMACVGVGGLTGAFISDRFGRRRVLNFAYIGVGVLGTALAFSSSFIMFVVIKSLLGLIIGSVSGAMTHLLECVAANKRSHAMNAVELFWVFGSSSLSLVSYLLREWWQVQIFISAPIIVCGLASIWLLDETPHWLQSKGRTDESLAVLRKMARWNRVEDSQKNLLISKNSTQSNGNDTPTSASPSADHQEGFFQIWSYRRVIVRCLVVCFGWFSCFLCYFALSFSVGELHGNIFLNNFLMCMMEGLGYAFCFGIAWWGRKWPTIGMLLGTGLSVLVSLLLMLYVENADTAVTVFSMGGKFAVSAAWQCLVVWGNELYPTNLRCTLGQLNSIAGRLGSVLAPFLINLPKLISVPNAEVIMPSVFVVVMTASGLLHIILPETNRCKLPATLREANAVSFPMALRDDTDSKAMDDHVSDNEEKC